MFKFLSLTVLVLSSFMTLNILCIKNPTINKNASNQEFTKKVDENKKSRRINVNTCVLCQLYEIDKYTKEELIRKRQELEHFLNHNVNQPDENLSKMFYFLPSNSYKHEIFNTVFIHLKCELIASLDQLYATLNNQESITTQRTNLNDYILVHLENLLGCMQNAQQSE